MSEVDEFTFIFPIRCVLECPISILDKLKTLSYRLKLNFAISQVILFETAFFSALSFAFCFPLFTGKLSWNKLKKLGLRLDLAVILWCQNTFKIFFDPF